MDVQTATVLIAGISVVIGVINSILSNRRAEKTRELALHTQQQALETRQAQLFMQIYNRWSSTEVSKGYGFLRYQYPDMQGEDLYYEPTDPYDEEKFVAIHSMNQFFEGIAVLEETGLLDISLIENMFSRRVVWFWERMESFYMFCRKHLNDPTQYDSLESLYKKLKQREQQRAPVTT